MAGGRVWGTLFFLFMTFASFSTVIAVFENLIANAIDNFGWSRKKAALVNCVSRRGWGFDGYLAEANTGDGLKLSARLKPYLRYVLPVLILIILVMGLLSAG